MAAKFPAKATVVSRKKSSALAKRPGNSWMKYCPARDYCFDAGRGTYWIKNQGGIWIMLNETQFKRELRQGGVSPTVPNNSYVSPLDEVLLGIQHNFDVHYAGPLAGYKAGVRKMGERRILVTESPHIIEPKRGDWPVLRTVIDGMLQSDKDRKFNQERYFFGWLKVAYKALRAGRPRPGQGLVFAGESDCGKSLLQNIITRILGGRVAKPYQFMAGETPFNSDLFGSEHQMIEDEETSTDIRSRRNFGAQWKGVTAADEKRCHAKNRTAVMLTPFWRLTVSVNDEPENLMVLPPIDDSIQDKLIILRGSKVPEGMPMPTETDEEREAFWETLMRELPAFIDFLIHWEISKELRGNRYGITHFHHPEILEAIDALAPEAKLLSLIDGECFEGSRFETDWKGTAEELERLLTNEDSPCRYEARRLLTYNNACGTYLGRLAKKYPGRFSLHRTETKREWTIKPLLETSDEMTA